MPVTHASDDYSFEPAIPSPLSVSVTPYSKRINQSLEAAPLYVSRYTAEESSDAAYQLDLQNRHFQLRKKRVIMVSIGILSLCMVAMMVRINNFLSGLNLSRFTIRTSSSHDMASRDSDGFFDNVSDEDWEQRVQRTKSILGEQDALNAVASSSDVEPAPFWSKNWQANFPCYQEVQIGNKFICDPFRIVSQAVEYLNSDGTTNVGRDCIVYVSGGDDLAFANQFLDYTLARGMEVGLTTPVCNVHIFNPNMQLEPQQERENLIIHKWGFRPKSAGNSTSATGATFKPIEETMQELGHKDKTISLMALDCEGCEWDIYPDLLSLSYPIHQLIIQTHGLPNPNQVHSMFNAMRMDGYVITHKQQEPAGNGEVFDYSFLKLSKSYLDQGR
ncbi:hypothetical protein ACHAXN_012298 [Cyclotella atomus]